jgi:alanyl-tRNA synthetase
VNILKELKLKETIPLYNENSYIKYFQAKVVSCSEQKITEEGQLYQVVLDATAFFPEGGGQPSDRGILDSVQVLDVQESEGIIYHTVTAPLTVGTEVTGEIDWNRRFDLMQHHTAEHIVSGLVHKNYDFDNVGFHMGSDAITIDFNGILTEKDIRNIEWQANQCIYSNISVRAEFPSAGELKEMDYRSKKELTGKVRIVTIPETDVCACCAPHVNFTGEIGCIKLISCQKYKGGVRVSMLCGSRALQDYNKKESSVSEISNLLSAKLYEVQDAVKKMKDENTDLKLSLGNLQKQLLTYKAERIPSDDNFIIFDNEIPPALLRSYGNLLTERCQKVCYIFTSTAQDEYKYVAASKTMDVRTIATELNQTFHGRGGGSKEMVQGSLTGTKEAIEHFIKELA